MSIFEAIKNKLKKPRDEILLQPEDEKTQRVQSLSPREYETYLILLEGFTLRYAAEQMGVKYPTVNTYVNAIYKKLGVSSRAQLIINYKDIKIGGNTQ